MPRCAAVVEPDEFDLVQSDDRETERQESTDEDFGETGCLTIQGRKEPVSVEARDTTSKEGTEVEFVQAATLMDESELQDIGTETTVAAGVKRMSAMMILADGDHGDVFYCVKIKSPVDPKGPRPSSRPYSYCIFRGKGVRIVDCPKISRSK